MIIETGEHLNKWNKSKILEYFNKNLKPGDVVILNFKTSNGRLIFKLFEVEDKE